jgi:hypothetical protein
MARAQQTQQESAPRHLSNSAARHDTIRSAVRQVSELEAKREKFRAQAREVGAEIKSVKNRIIQGELGFTLKDFAWAQGLYDSPEEIRARTIETLRECSAALGFGQQLDWITAVEQPEERRAPDAAAPAATAPQDDGKPWKDGEHPSAPEVQNFNKGRQAGLAGDRADTNPWPYGVKAWDTWQAGWVQGQKEMVEGLSPAANDGAAAPAPAAGDGGGELPLAEPEGRRRPLGTPSPAVKRPRGRPRKDGSPARPRA